MDLFDHHRESLARANAPLADRMRPRTLDEFIGQEHIIGPGRLLRRAIQIDQLSSVIFYGPPGTGKTTLARIIANTTRAQFLSINAVLAGVKDIRAAIESARRTLSLHSRRTILFVDEVHRFNKAQQDALLPHVENGTLILIGATTENPYFEVNKALVSRSRIFQLRSLDDSDLKRVAQQALADRERGYGGRPVVMEDDALEHLVHAANGDARGVLNALELAVETTAADDDGAVHISRRVAEESIQQRAVLYDKDGDVHYDTISAFIKSVRGSDPDAALYWMAKMVYAGEDPRFIFRRMLILASEDIGLADPRALGVVVDAARAFDYVGMPEGRYHLAQACLYLATAAKSNATMAFFDALATVGREATEDVPDHLRDASRDKEGFGHGENYLYPHAYRDHWVAQQYLPGALQGRLFYEPSDQGYERGIAEQVARRREAQVAAMVERRAGGALDAHDADGRDQWEKRTAEGGSELARIRDDLLAAADCRPDWMALDVDARTGLVTFELCRRLKQGTVWAAAFDEQSRETLVMMANKLEPLSRPRIVRAAPETLCADIRAEAGEEIRFDCITARNLIGAVADKPAAVRRLLSLTGRSGRIALAETVNAASPRLSALCGAAALEHRGPLERAEQSLFDNPDDPRVNWNVDSLRTELAAAGLTVRATRAVIEGRRRITPPDIDHWFRYAPDAQPPSLGDRIRAEGGEAVAKALQRTAHRLLDYQEIGWETVTGYFLIERQGDTQ
jgi:putative ATPase